MDRQPFTCGSRYGTCAHAHKCRHNCTHEHEQGYRRAAGSGARCKRVQRLDHPDARRLHQDSEQIAGLRPRLGEQRSHARSDGSNRPVVPGTSGQRHGTRGGRASRSNAATLHRDTGRGRRHGPPLRPHGQAARDDRLERGARPLDAGAARRQALRARRRRRRLLDVLVAPGAEDIAGTGDTPCALRRDHRGQRGKRQSRPALLHRSSARPDRRTEPRRLPGLRRRKLRSALVHDVAARHGHRQSARRRDSGRRPFGRRGRRRPVELSSAAHAAFAARERDGRQDSAALAACGNSRATRRAGASRHRSHRRPALGTFPVARRRAADGRRSGRDRVEPHLAPCACDYGRRRPAGHRQRRQHVAARNVGPREPQDSAGHFGRRCRRATDGAADAGPAARRPGPVRGSGQ